MGTTDDAGADRAARCQELTDFSGVCNGGLLLSLGLSSHDIRFFHNLGTVCHPGDFLFLMH